MDKLTMPSREFLVRQAVLNAAAEMFPGYASCGKLPRALAALGYAEVGLYGPSDRWPGESVLYKDIRTEFRKIASQYSDNSFKGMGGGAVAFDMQALMPLAPHGMAETITYKVGDARTLFSGGRELG